MRDVITLVGGGGWEERGEPNGLEELLTDEFTGLNLRLLQTVDKKTDINPQNNSPLFLTGASRSGGFDQRQLAAFLFSFAHGIRQKTKLCSDENNIFCLGR